MAGELRHFTNFVRGRPCAACGTKLGVQAHHALYGTTYSPDEARPSKSIPNARKGTSQKSHDYFSIPLCLKDHTPGLHKMAGFFEGWTGERLEIWEREQVEEMHELYDAEFPNGDPARVTRAAGKTGKPAPKSGPIGAVQKERARCAGVVRDVAAQPGVKDFEHALLMQAAERIEGGGESERF